MKTVSLTAASLCILAIAIDVSAAEDCSPYRSAYESAVAKTESVKDSVASASVIEARYDIAKREEDAAYFVLSSCELRSEKETLADDLATRAAKTAALNSADARFSERDYEGAVAGYEKVMDGESDRTSAEYVRAKEGAVRSRVALSSVSALKGDWRNARANAGKALELDPKNDRALYLVGYCYENEKNYGTASSYYSRAMDATSDPTLIAELKSRLSAVDKAREEEEAAVALRAEAEKIAESARTARLKKAVDSYFVKTKRNYAKYGQAAAKKKFAKLRDALSKYSFPDADRRFVRDYLMDLADKESR